MKDFVFVLGLIYWLLWFVDIVYYTAKNNSFLTSKAERIIHFLAVTLVILSWYIV